MKTTSTSNLDKDIKDFGLVMGAGYINGNYLYANIEPSGGGWYRQFLPNVKRWWFEIHEQMQEPDELGVDITSHAYEKYGSGGAWTLRGCMIKAQLALEKATDPSVRTTDPARASSGSEKIESVYDTTLKERS